MGVVTGDALGLPVQFLSREEVQSESITGMRGGGTFDMPAGTWSDDSSLTLCLTESLVEKGYDLNDIAERFVNWFQDGYCTPFAYAFDIGNATCEAMRNLIKGVAPLEAGPANTDNNGNGSLMRILPAAIYFAHLQDRELCQKICEVSKITHGHPRSLLGCSLYALYVKELLAGNKPETGYGNLQAKAQTLFQGSKLEKELVFYDRLIRGGLAELPEVEIESSGYIVHTLEAALWSFLITNSYKGAVLKAVNLGLDTDTVGAVTGGLAGIYYGLTGIPEEWIAVVIKKDGILELARKFAEIEELCE
jgi:ADP-ribosyl-[dinitrogen reductase] hydrolase